MRSLPAANRAKAQLGKSSAAAMSNRCASMWLGPRQSHEAVAYSTNRQEMKRPRRVIFDIAAEADDEVVDGTSVGVFVESPNVGQHGFSRNAFTLVLNQITQNTPFHLCQGEHAIADAQFQAIEIHR